MDGDATLGGGLDSDTLAGGSGNDVYYVDDLYDVIYGYGSEGTDDTVYVSVNGYHLSTEIEHVVYISGAEPLPYFINTLFSGYSWGNIGQSQSLTYSFVTQATDGVTGFAAYSTEQQAYVRLALSKYSAVSGLQFTEAVDSPEVGLRYFRDDLSSAGMGDYAGYASYPSGGDVHMKTDYVDMSPDAYGFQLLLHETGHALGLKHPFEAPVLDPAEDYQANTVMTYNISYPFAQDIGLFDLASIHYLYSVNHTARSGDDTYRIGDRYIWDGAGNDTLSAMDQTLSVSINLHAGSWLYAGSRGSSLLASGQAFIGFGTELENATGGSGNDTISGNEASNSLIGGIGEDTLTGYAGNDTLDGSAGLDSMIGGDGSDIYYVDNIGYSTCRLHPDRQRRERPHLSTTAANLTGNTLNNVLYAGAGNNVLNGGSGIDTVSYAYGLAGTSGVTVSLAVSTAQATGGSGSDTLTSIENLIGSAYADRLTGNTGANSLGGGRATTRSMAAPAATPWRVATAATATSSAMAAMSSARPMPCSPPAAPTPSTVICQRTP
jgi:Ca2+-binding RTX toxin-like protein